MHQFRWKLLAAAHGRDIAATVFEALQNPLIWGRSTPFSALTPVTT